MLPALIHKTSTDPMSDTIYPANAGRPLVAANTLQQAVHTETLARQPLDRPGAVGTLMHKPLTGLKAVFSTEEGYMHSALTPPTLFNKSRLAPKLPPAPDPLGDNIAELLDRLIQSLTSSVKGERIRIRGKNFTYRDKNLESEGSKYLSRLIRSDISKRNRMHLLAPGDLSQAPHFELKGEVWDEPQKISLRLRIEKGNTNRKLDSAAVDIAAQLLPAGLAVKPFLIGDPEGPYQFIVAEPFGQELLVVIASRKPIPMKTGTIIEPAWPYIRQLSDALSAHKDAGEMAAAHYIIVTKERKR